MNDLVRSNVYIPQSYKDAVPVGERISDFIREAMRREFKRRRIEVPEIPEVRVGNPNMRKAD